MREALVRLDGLEVAASLLATRAGLLAVVIGFEGASAVLERAVPLFFTEVRALAIGGSDRGTVVIERRALSELRAIPKLLAIRLGGHTVPILRRATTVTLARLGPRAVRRRDRRAVIPGDAAKSLAVTIRRCRAAGSGYHAFPVRQSTHALRRAVLGSLAVAVRRGHALLAARARAAAIRLAFVPAAFSVLFGASEPRRDERRKKPERKVSHERYYTLTR